MPKYMIQASYAGEGTKGVMKEGGTKRRATVEANVKAAGGSVEAFYFAFGEADAFVIVDLPDNATAAALSMAVNASGVVNLKTHVLLTPEEVDQAAKKSVKYRAPGKR
ncbi:MAG TPA: GYD domain-containing protein [Terriglobia bacterium]|nr:GYD domain-containing protein [Terriglobia bacterium]